MAHFVHIAPTKRVPSIRRSGIMAPLCDVEMVRGVFAMPVMPNFFMTHQWVRELKRRGQRQLSGVYFRIPDDEHVLVAHFGQSFITTTAAEAAAFLMRLDDARGYQVVIPRAVEPRAITRIRSMPLIGWRYAPGAHRRSFKCGCPYCIEWGGFRTRRFRDRYEAEERAEAARITALNAVIENESDELWTDGV